MCVKYGRSTPCRKFYAYDKMAAYVLLLNNREGRRRPIPRLFRERTILNSLRDEDVVSRYRLDRPAILELLGLIGNRLVMSNRGRAITPETQVFCKFCSLVDLYTCITAILFSLQ